MQRAIRYRQLRGGSSKGVYFKAGDLPKDAARQIQAARFAPLNKPYVLVNGDSGAGGGANVLSIGRDRKKSHARRGAADESQRTGLSSCAQTSAHNCRFGRGARDLATPSGRGVAVSTTRDWVSWIYPAHYP